MYRARTDNEKHTGPIQIGALFEKYKKRLRPPQGVVVSAFCAAVASTLGVAVDEREVRYNVASQTVCVTTSGPQKSEILFNKTRILQLCREVLGDIGVPRHVV